MHGRGVELFGAFGRALGAVLADDAPQLIGEHLFGGVVAAVAAVDVDTDLGQIDGQLRTDRGARLRLAGQHQPPGSKSAVICAARVAMSRAFCWIASSARHWIWLCDDA